MPYQVQKGDTISAVKDLMKMSWKTLKRLNPDAVGRSSQTGNWFLKEGAVIRSDADFAAVLRQKQEEKTGPPPEKSAPDSSQVLAYTIKPGDTLWALAVKKFHVNIEDLLRDNQIEDPRRVKPGQVIQVRRREYPQEETVTASWYGENHHGRPMANGQIYNMYADTIAHKELPFGTRIGLENPLTGETVKAVVTDRGPYVEGRDIDVSYGLARKLSLIEKGVVNLKMRVSG
ncbi:MAG: septal ring lytic transglycosylase RlpA family protein [Pseudomonadota bacterium]